MSDDDREVRTFWLPFQDGEIALSADLTGIHHAMGRHEKPVPECAKCREAVRSTDEHK